MSAETSTSSNISNGLLGKTISSILALVLGVGAVVLPMRQSIQELDRRLQTAEAKLTEHTDSLGHPGMKGKIDVLNERLNTVRMTLQQFMETNRIATRELDDKLQLEIRGQGSLRDSLRDIVDREMGQAKEEREALRTRVRMLELELAKLAGKKEP